MRPRPLRAAALGAALLAAPAAAGCQSQWYQVSSLDERVITNVEVRTVPSGATVYLDDARMAPSPVRIPVAYPHEVSLWERQTNAGAQIRESTGWVGTILLFPIWIPASFFHYREDMKRHVYGTNVHRLRARFPDGSDVEKEVTLEGQAEVIIELKSEAPAPAVAPPKAVPPGGKPPEPIPGTSRMGPTPDVPKDASVPPVAPAKKP